MTEAEKRARAFWAELQELSPDYDGYGIPEPQTKWLEVAIKHFALAQEGDSVDDAPGPRGASG